ncbi:MAG: CRISPR-associated helicase Cas3' [Deltaproteobacteria bacterium]|nr:CRISPR-associated helicase Cas3' [Deltaproteobacteria bacterium]
MKEIIAHTSEDKRTHSLENHLIYTANLALNFAAEFGASEWGYLAGVWHDLGKFSDDFQKMISLAQSMDGNNKSKKNKVNHSTAGALWAIEKFGLAGRIFSYLIAGHHAGLPDWMPDETGNAALSIRLKDLSHLEVLPKAKIPPHILEKDLPKQRPPQGADPAFWIRMLFSCLVDADFLDTEAFFERDKSARRGNYPEMSTLLTNFSTFMNEVSSQAANTHVNQLRASILARCIEKASDKPGAFTLTVPTGGGKTLSSMAFALHHAIKHHKRRIIYVIPYISIIEQTADQFRSIFHESLIEHHSNLEPQEEDETDMQRSLACENWDAPVIVTTAVQFFESLFASRTGQCRKLHNIANSVIVLDEAQLLPPDFLNPILHVLNELRKHYGVTLLLSTATQPALMPQPSFAFNGLPDTQEIIEKPDALHKDLKRVKITIMKTLTEAIEWEDLSQELRQHPSVLCIVNRRDDCRKLWQLMPEGTFHLSALMCGAHRSNTIAEIKDRLKNGLPARVISTQLVEAGVDLDFPVVYRALCGLDSVAQAAGRCNREGLLKAGQVVIFRPPTDPPIGHLRQAAGIGKRLLEQECDDPITPERFTMFFQELYWLQGERLDKEGILRDLNPDREFRFSFRTAAQKFKMIDETQQKSLIVSYRDEANLIEELERRPPDRRLLRKLQRYIVNLPRYLHDRLVNEGAIRLVHPGIFTQGHSAMYDEVIGFCADRSAIYDPDDLII